MYNWLRETLQHRLSNLQVRKPDRGFLRAVTAPGAELLLGKPQAGMERGNDQRWGSNLHQRQKKRRSTQRTLQSRYDAKASPACPVPGARCSVPDDRCRFAAAKRALETGSRLADSNPEVQKQAGAATTSTTRTKFRYI